MHEDIRARVFKRVNALEKGYRQNLGIIGPQGVGKTVLLHSIFHSLCGQSQFIPVYINADSIDAEGLIDKWLEAMLRGVFLSQEVLPPSGLDSLIFAADPVIPKTTERVKLIKKSLRKEKNSALVRELFSLTGLLAEETSKKVILIIDEFQDLSILPAADPFSLLGKEIMVEQNTLYLVSSSNPRKAREIFHEKLTLLFANFEVLELGAYEIEGAMQYLRHQIPSYEFSSAQLKMMIQATGAHPGYMRILVRAMRERCFQISDFHSDLRSAIPQDVFFEAFKSQLFDRCGSLSLLFEKKLQGLESGKDRASCLRLLTCLSDGPAKPSDLSHQMDVKVTEIKKTMGRLIDNDIVHRSGSFYFIHDVLFSFWLKEVYATRQSLDLPGFSSENRFMTTLEGFFLTVQEADGSNLEVLLEGLLRKFQDETVELEGKKFNCPKFSEVLTRPGTGKKAVVFAREHNLRWACQIFDQKIREEDVLSFLADIKHSSRFSHKKLLIALSDIDQNAKLLAQESKILIWHPKDLNFYCFLFKMPQLMILPKQEINETSMGALAQSIHSA